MDRARNGEYFAALFGSEFCSDHRARGKRCLDDEATAGEARDQTVATGKVARCRRRTQRELGEQRAMPGNLSGKGLVAPGIDDVDACAEHSDSRPAALQAAAVCRTVDPERQAAYDSQPGVAEGARKALSVFKALGRGITAAYNCQCGRIQQPRVSNNVQQRWRVGDLQELFGIFGISESYDCVYGLFRPLQCFVDLAAKFALQDARREGVVDDVAQLGPSRDQNVGGKTEGGKKGTEALATEPGNKTELYPGCKFNRVAHPEASQQ